MVRRSSGVKYCILIRSMFVPKHKEIKRLVSQKKFRYVQRYLPKKKSPELAVTKSSENVTVFTIFWLFFASQF